MEYAHVYEVGCQSAPTPVKSFYMWGHKTREITKYPALINQFCSDLAYRALDVSSNCWTTIRMCRSTAAAAPLAKIVGTCRFMEAESKLSNENKFCYVPFGAGRHRCIGESFAYIQNKTIWSVLLEMFELHSVDKFPEPNYQSMIHTPSRSVVAYNRRVPPKWMAQAWSSLAFFLEWTGICQCTFCFQA